jgi:hypothetical protein
MTTKLKLLATAGGVAVGMFGALPAFAAGTTANSTITNTATVNYQVGGVAQNAINASNNITVDRRINLTVAEVGNATTSVSPGATNRAVTFTVTNTSNAPLDFGLSSVQQAGGAATHGGTDTFDTTGAFFAIDTNSNGTYEAGTDTVVTFLDEVAADATVRVMIVSNIPLGEANGEIADVALVAQAREAGTAGAQGAVVTQTAGANTAGMDTVFGDTAGTNDALRDGQHSDDDDYTVAAPTLTVTKQSRPISDPFNGTTNPKMIPGAVVEYCIVVSNAAGSAAADSVAISDPVPAQTTYDATYGIFQNGTYTGTTPTGTCNLDGAAGGSFSAGTVNGSLGTLAAGATRTIYFRVTIN